MSTQRKSLLAALAILLPAAAFVAAPASAATAGHKITTHHATHKVALHHKLAPHHAVHRVSAHHAAHKKVLGHTSS